MSDIPVWPQTSVDTEENAHACLSGSDLVSIPSGAADSYFGIGDLLDKFESVG